MSPILKEQGRGHDWGRKRAPQIEQHSVLHVSSLPLAPGPTQQTTHLIFPPPPQNTKHYELLNYSEHGTTVDNVLYSCDFSEKTPPTPPSSIVAKVQSVISKLEQRPVATKPAILGHILQGHSQGGSGLLPMIYCLLPPHPVGQVLARGPREGLGEASAMHPQMCTHLLGDFSAF